MVEQKKKYCEALYLSNDIISSLYDYNFNMLNSTDQNAILFTNGDNDNYPAWVLQEAKGVRPDVTIMNVHTVFVLRDYLKLKLEERDIEIDVELLYKEDIAKFLSELISAIKKKHQGISIHIALTVYDAYKSEIKDNLYLTGLVYKYSEEPIDNISIIKTNLEQNLRLDYLDLDWYNEGHITSEMMDRYNLNYIPAFLELAKVYSTSDQIDSFIYWKEKALILARRVQDESLMEEINSVN
jgi:hypothetical protein